MSIIFVPSQDGSPLDTEFEPWTGNPIRLCFNDLKLIWKNRGKIIGIFLPLRPTQTNRYGELYPSISHAYAISVFIITGVAQIIFLGSLPILVMTMIPGLWIGIYVTGFLLFNYLFTLPLNGKQLILNSDPKIVVSPEVSNEYWIYLNGVATGHQWLQDNIDRLSLTFRRRIVGVHNPTYGPVFDLIQCIVQRNFGYATEDVRSAYTSIKSALINKQHSKVVFILHSQGGIMGSLIINWLLAEVPRSTLSELEVYTFGNAANHFSNPLISDRQQSEGNPGCGDQKFPHQPMHKHVLTRTIRHIEHYANEGEFVAQFGVLAFVHARNRYSGRIFKIPVSGHLLNQHYLDRIFPLDKNNHVDEDNKFMNRKVIVEGRENCNSIVESLCGDCDQSFYLDTDDNMVVGIEGLDGVGMYPQQRILRELKVKDFSRLWGYRNGRRIVDDKDPAMNVWKSGD